MDDWDGSDSRSDGGDWEWRHILFPRYALKVTRTGMRVRIVWPGRYLVRWSRTYKRNVYRSH